MPPLSVPPALQRKCLPAKPYTTMQRTTTVLLLAALAGCGGGDFEVPETREEQLAMLNEKEGEIRRLRAEIKLLEEASGEADALPEARLVLADTVRAVDFRREVELQATVESDDVAAVTVEVPGRVTAVLVDDGDYVRRGQTLLRVDVEQFDLQKAELETQLSLARDILSRQERLRAQDIGTEVQYLEAQNAVERLEKAVAQLDLQRGKSGVTAPISGTIENKTVNAGEYAAPGQPLMQILDAATVKVVADVPETYLRTVKRGMEVRIDFPAIDGERTAKITEIGRTIDPANRTFEIEMQLVNRGGALKPNMLANVYLVDYEVADAVAVPASVVLQEIDGTEYVFVARSSDVAADYYTARKVYVETGENDATRREIRRGLSPGDVLVTEGMRSLTDGELIRLQFDRDPLAVR